MKACCGVCFPYHVRAMKPQRKLSEIIVRILVLRPAPNYAGAIGYTLSGCFICAFGIFTYVKADMIPLSAEGFCLALRSTFKWRFSRVKVAVDCSMLLIAVLSSLIFLGRVAGVREGSVICAVSTGYIIGWFFKVCPLWDKVFSMFGATANPDNKLS